MTSPAAVVRRERVRHLVGRCRGCGNRLLFVRAVGWFDPDSRHPYDICPDDRFGNHLPDAATVVERGP